MKFTEISNAAWHRDEGTNKRARLNQLFNERAILRANVQVDGSNKLLVDKLTRLEEMIVALEESMSPLAAAKARLAQLEADFDDLPKNPTSQQGYDALDDIQDMIKKQKAKVASLSEAAPAPKVRDASNDPTIAFELAQRRAMMSLEKLKAQIEKLAQEHQQNSRDWGYPGSIGHVAGQLEELVEFLGNKEQR